MTEKELKIAEKYRDVLFIIYYVANKEIKQSQLEDILLDTHFVNNKVGATRLLARLEKIKFLYTERVEGKKYNIVRLRKPGLQFLLNRSAEKVQTAKLGYDPEMKRLRREVFVDFFYRHYIKDRNVTLHDVVVFLEFGRTNFVTNSVRLYDIINNNQSFVDSLNDEAKYRNELNEVNKFLKMKTLVGKTKEKVDLSAIDSDVMTLERLKLRNVFLMNFKSRNYDILYCKSDDYFLKTKKQLMLDFTYIISAKEPNISQIKKIYQELQSYITNNFKFREFDDDVRFVSVKATLDVVVMNVLALDSIEENFKKNDDLKPFQIGYYEFDIKLKHCHVADIHKSISAFTNVEKVVEYSTIEELERDRLDKIAKYMPQVEATIAKKAAIEREREARKQAEQQRLMKLQQQLEASRYYRYDFSAKLTDHQLIEFIKCNLHLNIDHIIDDIVNDSSVYNEFNSNLNQLFLSLNDFSEFRYSNLDNFKKSQEIYLELKKKHLDSKKSYFKYYFSYDKRKNLYEIRQFKEEDLPVHAPNREQNIKAAYIKKKMF